jgi:hypothetical protein
MELFLIKELSFLIESLLNSSSSLDNKSRILSLVNLKIDEIESQEIFYRLNLYKPENASKFSSGEISTLETLSSYARQLIALSNGLSRELTESYNQYLYEKESILRLTRDSETKIRALEAYRDQVNTLINLVNSKTDWLVGQLNVDDAFNGITLPILKTEIVTPKVITPFQINGSSFGFPYDVNSYIDSDEIRSIVDSNPNTFFSFSKIRTRNCEGGFEFSFTRGEIVNAVEVDVVADGFGNEIALEKVEVRKPSGLKETINLNRIITGRKVIVFNPIEAISVRVTFKSSGSKEVTTPTGLNTTQASFSIKEARLIRFTFGVEGSLKSRNLNAANSTLFINKLDTEETNTEAFESQVIINSEPPKLLDALSGDVNDFVSTGSVSPDLILTLKRKANFELLTNLTGKETPSNISYSTHYPTGSSPEVVFLNEGAEWGKIGVCQLTGLDFNNELRYPFASSFNDVTNTYKYFEVLDYSLEELVGNIKVYSLGRELYAGINDLPLSREYCILSGASPQIVVNISDLPDDERVYLSFVRKEPFSSYSGEGLVINLNEPIFPDVETVKVFNKLNPVIYSERSVATRIRTFIRLSKKNIVPGTVNLVNMITSTPMEFQEVEFLPGDLVENVEGVEDDKIYMNYKDGVIYFNSRPPEDVLCRYQYQELKEVEGVKLVSSTRDLVEGVYLPTDSVQISSMREAIAPNPQGIQKLKKGQVIKGSIIIEQPDSSLRFNEFVYKDGWDEFRGNSKVKVTVSSISSAGINIWKCRFNVNGAIDASVPLEPESELLMREVPFVIAGIGLLGEGEYMVDFGSNHIYFYSEATPDYFDVNVSFEDSSSNVKWSCDYRNGVLYLDNFAGLGGFINYQACQLEVGYQQARLVKINRRTNDFIEINYANIDQDKELFIVKVIQEKEKLEKLISYYSPVVKSLVIGRI